MLLIVFQQKVLISVDQFCVCFGLEKHILATLDGDLSWIYIVLLS